MTEQANRITAFLTSAETSSREPTMSLRWNNGVLEQMWITTTFGAEGTTVGREWHPVAVHNQADQTEPQE